jgi:hypothetical protein
MEGRDLAGASQAHVISVVLVALFAGRCMLLGSAAPGPRSAGRAAAACGPAGGAIRAAGFSTFATDLGHVIPILTDGFATLTTDLGHVLAIAAHRLAALPTSIPGLFRTELVRSSLFVGGFATLAGDFALLSLVHSRESAATLFGHCLSPF